MNKLFLILFLIFTSLCLQAQPPQGGNRGMGRGNRQGSPSGMRQRGELRGEARGGEQLRLDSFPEIPDITIEQRADVGIILVKEQQEIFKQVQKKRELMEKDKQSPDRSEKEKAKMQKNLADVDGKIQKQIEKSNEKIRKILSDKQYQVFLEKRNDFRFNRITPPRFRQSEEGGFRRRSEGRGGSEFGQ
jgi:hypothetical protein